MDENALIQKILSHWYPPGDPFAQSGVGGLQIKQMVSMLIDSVEAGGNVIYITSGYATGGHNSGSSHYIGLAIDYQIDGPNGILPSPQQEEYAKRIGFWTLDEFLHPSAASSGPHIHAEYRSGYTPLLPGSDNAGFIQTETSNVIATLNNDINFSQGSSEQNKASRAIIIAGCALAILFLWRYL
jgi:hypothetical protein